MSCERRASPPGSSAWTSSAHRAIPSWCWPRPGTERRPNGELTCGLLEGINPAYRDISDDPQAVIEEMLGEVDGLDADSQRAQFAELIAADAFSQAERR